MSTKAVKIYIATKFENQDEFHQLKRMLEACGHVVTHDWTKESCDNAPPGKLEEYKTDCALNDVEGVHNADLLVLIPYHKPMAGAFVEFGIAVALGKPVVLVKRAGVFFQDNIFYSLPDVTPLPDFESVVTFVNQYQEELANV